jgi:molybdopterin-guanine dinucleotide biosynthesis protein A
MPNPALPSTESRWPAYILAGGQSSRFGSDKARVEIAGRANVVRLAEQLQSRGCAVALVAQQTRDYADLGIRTLSDAIPNAGPLAGVITALEDLRLRCNPPRGSDDRLPDANANCWILTCDLLGSDWSWMDRLMAEHLPTALVTAFEEDAFRPFPAIYTHAMLSVAKRVWGEGGRSMRSAFSAAGPRVHWVPPRGIALPRSFNTPEELQRALAELDS